jgi:hypothetical protein
MMDTWLLQRWSKQPAPTRRSWIGVSCTALLTLSVVLLSNPVWGAQPTKPQKELPLPGEVFEVEGHTLTELTSEEQSLIRRHYPELFASGANVK